MKYIPHAALLLLALAIPGCGGGGSDSGSIRLDALVPEPGDMTAVYAPTPEDFPNPERGFMDWIYLLEQTDFSFVRDRGFRLAYAGVDLGAYRSSPLPGSFLDRLEDGLTGVRAAGIKVVLRCFYANYHGEADAPKEVILGHIAQLSPLFHEYGDVISVFQAGFIGTWGEWHGSTNGLSSTADRAEVLSAMLAATPRNRFVQVRCPHYKQEIFQADPAGGWSESDAGRTGHHNDAFLGSYNDYNTYLAPMEAWKDWLAADSAFMPVGGETNEYNPPRSNGATAIEEMRRFHWSFINWHFDKRVIQSWRDDGTYDEIHRDLGYRLRLVEGLWTPAVAPGGRLRAAVRIRNDGYAPMYNRRPVYFVLDDGVNRFEAELEGVDPRTWAAGADATFLAEMRVPADIPPGTYKLALWLPDEADALRYRSSYAVRLANEGIWDSDGAYNVLTDSITVDPGQEGDIDPGARRFETIE